MPPSGGSVNKMPRKKKQEKQSKRAKQTDEVRNLLDFLDGPYVKDIVIQRAVIADYEGQNQRNAFIITWNEARIFGDAKTTTRKANRARRKSTT